jgi:hypothetical protein
MEKRRLAPTRERVVQAVSSLAEISFFLDFIPSGKTQPMKILLILLVLLERQFVIQRKDSFPFWNNV